MEGIEIKKEGSTIFERTTLRNRSSTLSKGSCETPGDVTLQSVATRLRGIGIPLLAFSAIPAVAAADVPVPTFFGFEAPFFLSVKTVGLLFIGIVILEAAVLKFGLTWPVWKALAASGLANVVSSLYGLLIPAFSLLSWIALVVGVVFYRHFRKQEYSRGTCLVFGFAPAALMMVLVVLAFPLRAGANTWSLYVSLVPAFLLSVLLETFVIEWAFRVRNIWRWTIQGNAASYALIVAVMIHFSISMTDNPLMTQDYLYTTAMSALQEGRTATAERMAEEMDKLGGDESVYHVGWELRIARRLAEIGERQRAKHILERVQKSQWKQKLPAVEVQSVEKIIRELEPLIGQDRPNAVDRITSPSAAGS